MTTFPLRHLLVPTLAALVSTAAAADTTCQAVDIGSLGLGYTIAEAMNPAGHVVGSSVVRGSILPTSHAFIWRDGVMKDLGTLAAAPQSSRALAINATDQVVGNGTDSAGAYHGWIWQNGAMTELPFWAVGGINDNGLVVGAEQVAAGSWHLVGWKAGTLTDYGDVGGDTPWAEGVNKSGRIVVYRGSAPNLTGCIQYADGLRTTADIGNPHHHLDAIPLGILDDGWVFGHASNEYMPGGYTWQGFLWNDGAFTILPSLGPGAMSSAWAANSAHQAVGYSETKLDSPDEHAVLWNQGAVSDLNLRLTDSVGTGDLFCGVGITDTGTIAVQGQTYPVSGGAFTMRTSVYVLRPVATSTSIGSGTNSVSAASDAAASGAASGGGNGGGGASGCGAGSGVAAMLVALGLASGVRRRR